MTCKTCGERMDGDGYTRVRHCPNALDTDYAEPDANPIHCSFEAELLSRFVELNFNNYDQDQVEALQAWAFEAHELLTLALNKDK